MHIVDTTIRSWFQDRIESVKGKPNYEFDTRYHLLERLTAAEGLEKYLGSRYPGTKRFGLEGAEILFLIVFLSQPPSKMLLNTITEVKICREMVKDMVCPLVLIRYFV